MSNKDTGETEMLPPLSIINILGVRITSEPIENVLSAIRHILIQDDRDGLYVCATSVHGVVEAQSDPELKRTINGAFISHPDGAPLAKVGQWLGAKFIKQIRGPDIFPVICEMTSTMNVRHFFYGGAEGVAEDLASNMQAKFPGLQVAGTYCPPFRRLEINEVTEIIETIKNSQADIVWVGLSTPKQEMWMAEFHDKINAKILFSIGAAFDFHTNRIKFAPNWIRSLGLEWFYRLCSEPRRLWRRYLKIVPTFILLATLQLTGVRSYE